MTKQIEMMERTIIFDDKCKVTYSGMVWPILETMKHKIKDMHQNIVLISGRTGTGKSEFAIQIGKFLDPKNFGLHNIYWTTDTLIEAATNPDNVYPRGTVFIFDEAREGTQSLNAMSETNRKMGLFLDTIRSRGYHILLLQPSFFMFQKSFAIYVADFLFHIEKQGNDRFMEQIEAGLIGDEITEKPFTRGYGIIYGYEEKKKMYIKGKRMDDMNAVRGARFTFGKSRGIINWAEYEKLKQVAVAAMNAQEDKQLDSSKDFGVRAQKLLAFKRKAYALLRDKHGYTYDMIASEFEETYQNVVQAYNYGGELIKK